MGVFHCRLATTCCYRSIGHLFGVAKDTCSVIVNETCHAMVSALLSRFIKFPQGDILIENVRVFEEQMVFPQAAGAVDCTHLPIIRPHEYHTDYYNRKGFYSLVMQAVVDSKYRFIDLYLGWPGRVHDARILVNSTLYVKGQSNSLFRTHINMVKEIEGHVDMTLLI